MLIDAERQFLTQRVHAKMALFKLSLTTEAMIVNYQGHSIAIPLAQEPTELFNAQIWDDTVSVSEVDKQYSEWFSDQLGINCRLVQFPEENARRVDSEYVPQEEHVSLADAYPFLIIGQSSLDDLNKRLPTVISMKRFRPNLVFSGGEPYEEDGWKNFTIGSTGFIGVKRCARCALPTVDPETAEKGVEPSRTLATYRRFENKVYFGQNLIAADLGEIHVGDRITLKRP
jgi:uncharacterized protein YcbX